MLESEQQSALRLISLEANYLLFERELISNNEGRNALPPPSAAVHQIQPGYICNADLQRIGHDAQAHPVACSENQLDDVCFQTCAWRLMLHQSW